MRPPKSVYIIGVIVIALFHLKCSENQIYESSVEIPEGIWSSKNAAIFEPEITDTLSLFDLNLNISCTNEYRYSNIWFFIKSISPKGMAHIDTLEVVLSEDNGKWLGNKSDDRYTLNYNFQKKIRFGVKGKFTFEFIQGMRDTELKGIEKFGFEIVKSN